LPVTKNHAQFCKAKTYQINGTGEAEKKTKFNLSTTNKGTKIKTNLKTLFDYAFLFENTRI